MMSLFGSVNYFAVLSCEINWFYSSSLIIAVFGSSGRSIRSPNKIVSPSEFSGSGSLPTKPLICSVLSSDIFVRNSSLLLLFSIVLYKGDATLP